jgi:site-specific recombinase XerD
MAGKSVTPTALDALRLEQTKLTAGIVARSTVLNYATDWRIFQNFCTRFELTALPATEETISLFLTDQLRAHKISTARRRKWAIAFHHRAAGLADPLTPGIKQLLRGAQRLRLEKPRQMRPITVRELRKMSAGLAHTGRVIDLRNRALLVVGFASSLRRSNLTALNLPGDVEFCKEGLILSVQREKQDQEGKGRLVGIPRGRHADTDPARVLRGWLRVRGGDPGPLFPRLDPTHEGEVLSGQGVCRVVKKCVMGIGMDAAQYGAHSLRAGFVTAAGEANINTLRISGYTAQCPEIVQLYFRRSELWRNNVCGQVGL